MSYTRITSTRSASKALQYLMSDAHDGSNQRNQLLSGINMFDASVIPYDAQMNGYINRASDRMQVEARRVIQSFSRKELNPDNPDDIIKAHEIGCATAEKLFPGHQCVVATQTDGKSGLVHNHLIVCNVDMFTMKGMTGSEYNLYHIRDVSDAIVQEHGVTLDHGAECDKYTQTERARREQGKYVWKDDLRERISVALQDSRDYDEFENALAFQGVSIRIGKTVTYTLDDTTQYEAEMQKSPKRALKSRASKLGKEYDKDALEETFHQNSAYAASQQQPLQQTQINDNLESQDDLSPVDEKVSEIASDDVTEVVVDEERERKRRIASRLKDTSHFREFETGCEDGCDYSM